MSTHLDFETGSDEDIKNGAYKYSVHSSTTVHCFSVTEYDKEKGVVLSTENFRGDAACPKVLLKALERGEKINAWNATFERLIWNQVMHKHGWPKVKASDFIDTAALSRVHGGPAGLEHAAQFWGVGSSKHKEGQAVMRKWSRCTTTDYGCDEYSSLQSYCAQDTVLDATLYGMFNDLSEIEQAIYLHNDAVNDRGIKVDLVLAESAVKLAGDLKAAANYKIDKLTDGAVTKVTQVQRIKGWLVSSGVMKEAPSSLGREYIAAYCATHNNVAAEVLTLRTRFGGNAAAKYSTAAASEVNGIVHGAFRYYGAPATGRYTSHNVQLHNLVRKKPAVSPETSVALIKSGASNLRLVYEESEIFNQLSYTVRSLLVPRKGNVYVVADYASIEAKVLPWIAEKCGFNSAEYLDSWAEGVDAYKLQAMLMFGKEVVEDVTDEERQAGKVTCLACGYQGGYRALQSMASNYGMHLDDKTARRWVDAWRWSNTWAVDFWTALEAAASDINVGGTTYVGRTESVRLHMPYQGCLRLYAPSQGFIQYNGVHIALEPDPAFRNNFSNNMVRLYKKGTGKVKVGGAWPEIRLYSGVFAENLTQKVARDLLCSAMLQCEAAGYAVVAHVHDEIVLEVKEKDADAALSFLLGVMKHLPSWAEGLPMGGEGRVISRYQKV